MLALSVIFYLAVTVAIGVWASKKVSTSSDFAVAGRSLPIYLSASAFFATWFGAETILGASSEFVQHGLIGVIEDPFGASLCLMLVALIFAKPLYRLNMLSLGDFYKDRFGSKAELLSSGLMIVSFFGWTAAQFIAFGLVFHFVAGVSVATGIAVGVVIVILYTSFGGMWAVSLTDFIQTIVIIVGLIIVASQLITLNGGIVTLADNAPKDFLKIYPSNGNISWPEYVAAWITIGLGSIPSQDVFQRINSTRSATTAQRSAFLGGLLYLTIALIPLVIGLCAIRLEPGMLNGDTQRFLPSVIMKYSPFWVQVLFFGALMSAILSSASAGVLAPSTILAENIFRRIWPAMDDRRFLFTLRISVVMVALICYVVTFFRTNIFELVGDSSALTLVSLFVPLVAGLFLKNAHPAASIGAMITGTLTWVFFRMTEASFPAILAGLLASLISFVPVAIYFRIRRGKDPLSSS